MPRAKTAQSYASDSTENEFDRLDSDLTKLKRQYRNLQNDKQKLKNKVEKQMLSYKQEIHQLTREKTHYETELKLADSDQNAKFDNLTLTRMQTNLQNKANVMKLIEDQKKYQEEVNKDILLWSKKLTEQRKKMGGAETTNNSHKVVNRKLDIAEGNLHRESSKFNNILANNEKFRHRIQTLRHEKEKFKVKFNLLNAKYQDNKKNISNVVESSTAAYESMLEARAKIKVQQEKSQKELEQFVNEITTEEKKIDHELRQQGFMNIKSLERDDSERINREKDHARQQAEAKSNRLNDLEVAWNKICSICQEEESHFDGNDSAIGSGDENQIRDNATTAAENRELPATTLTHNAPTSELHVDRCIRKFVENEEANFALFNFVSDQNNDIEKMQEELDKIRQEQENNTSQLEAVEKQATDDFDELENQKLELEAAEELALKKIETESENLKNISTGVLQLFEKLNCDEEDLGIALKSDMLDEYIATYLAVIEAKLNQLLSAKIYLRSQDPDNDEDFTAGDAIREVLGKIEKPRIINQPILSLFETQFQQMAQDRNATSITAQTIKDDNDSDNETGNNLMQTTDTKLMQIADTGMILSYDQLRDRVANDIGQRKLSIIPKGANKRSSLARLDTAVGNSLDNSVEVPNREI